MSRATAALAREMPSCPLSYFEQRPPSPAGSDRVRNLLLSGGSRRTAEAAAVAEPGQDRGRSHRPNPGEALGWQAGWRRRKLAAPVRRSDIRPDRGRTHRGAPTPQRLVSGCGLMTGSGGAGNRRAHRRRSVSGTVQARQEAPQSAREAPGLATPDTHSSVSSRPLEGLQPPPRNAAFAKSSSGDAGGRAGVSLSS
jgi:hypothetical protein